jgi:N6-adenosine-specific RNA methylase IME4
VKYRTIVADPPWPLNDMPAPARVSEGYSGSGPRTTGSTKRILAVPYQRMSISDIEALPVGALADNDAHLYLWTINRHLEAAYGVVRCWGFRPSQLLVWTKRPKGILFGTYTSTTEFVLFCRRGVLAPLRRVDTTWFGWPRSNTHSKKPEAFLDLVERVSPGPYLELFARRNRLGWDTWGNESLEHVELA